MDIVQEQLSVLSGYLDVLKIQLLQGELLWPCVGLGVALLLLLVFLRLRGQVKIAEQILTPPTAATSAGIDLESEHTVSGGLSKTRSKFFSGLKNLFDGSKSPEQIDLLGELEELLIASDIGVKTTQQLLQNFRGDGYHSSELDLETVRTELKRAVTEILDDPVDPLIEPKKVAGNPKVILVVGVNGVGKTTTIGKLAAQFRVQGASVLIGACDTFRAAAGAQLEEWARRANAEIVQGAEGTKPTTVAFETIARGLKEKFDVIIIDTAGRLHTKVNLMNELSSVVKIIARELPGAPHETLLVLDASTGQNAVQQAREFHGRVSLSGIVITKLDGTPKGGVVVAIKDELKTPIRYIGVGEGLGDLRPFFADEFVDALFGDVSLVEPEFVDSSAHGDVRKRRVRQSY